MKPLIPLTCMEMRIFCVEWTLYDTYLRGLKKRAGTKVQ